MVLRLTQRKCCSTLTGAVPSVAMSVILLPQVPAIRIPGTFWSSHPPKYDDLRQDEVRRLLASPFLLVVNPMFSTSQTTCKLGTLIKSGATRLSLCALLACSSSTLAGGGTVPGKAGRRTCQAWRQSCEEDGGFGHQARHSNWCASSQSEVSCCSNHICTQAVFCRALLSQLLLSSLGLISLCKCIPID